MFLYTSCKTINPLIPSDWNVQKYPLIQFQWNHSSYSSYNQRSPRKVNFIFLEHFYSCLVVLLIVIVSDISWRSRRSIWRRTRRFEDFVEPGKQPLDHVYETLSMHVMLHFINIASESWRDGNHFGGLPSLLSCWYLHCAWPYLLMRVMPVGVDRMLK